jgi:hypothetical protein
MLDLHMFRPTLFAMLWMFVSSCNDHSEEIAECQQCDTLFNLTVGFADPTAPADGDIRRTVVLQNGRKEFLINDTIHAGDSIRIIHRGTNHVYYGFRKDWYVTANMFDHHAGRCGLHDYFVDGIEVNQSGTVLTIPK